MKPQNQQRRTSAPAKTLRIEPKTLSNNVPAFDLYSGKTYIGRVATREEASAALKAYAETGERPVRNRVETCAERHATVSIRHTQSGKRWDVRGREGVGKEARYNITVGTFLTAEAAKAAAEAFIATGAKVWQGQGSRQCVSGQRAPRGKDRQPRKTRSAKPKLRVLPPPPAPVLRNQRSLDRIEMMRAAWSRTA